MNVKLVLRRTRLLLSGAIVGAAVGSLIANYMGVDQTQIKEVISAALGGGTTLVLIKLLHIA